MTFDLHEYQQHNNNNIIINFPFHHSTQTLSNEQTF